KTPATRCSNPLRSAEIDFGLSAACDAVKEESFEAAFLQAIVDRMERSFLLDAQGVSRESCGRRNVGVESSPFRSLASSRQPFVNFDVAQCLESLQALISIAAGDLSHQCLVLD